MRPTEPLCTPFNVAVLQACNRLWPCGFDVSDTAPDTYAAVRDEIARRGRLTVWSGASDGTVFGDPEVNYAFRAWHDGCHFIGQHDFSREGELAALAIQQDHIRTIYGPGHAADVFCALLDAEVRGQLDYCDEHGSFPDDQRACAEAFLARHYPGLSLAV